MILLDTSVVVDALQNPGAGLRRVFIAAGAAICGVTRAEVLHGARSDADWERLAAALDGFPQVAIPETHWNEVGRSLYILRSAGVTVPLADAIIATVAVQNGLELWTRDAHCATIQRVLPALQLYPEPP